MQAVLGQVRRMVRASRRHQRVVHRAYEFSWPAARFVGAAYRRMALRRTCVIAIVGSFGKTTTNRVLTAALLGPGAYRPFGNFGTGLAHRLLETAPRDPYVALEVGINGPGVMAGFAHLIAPDVVVVTGIGSEHNTSLGTLEATRREKAEMVRAIQPNGVAVLNGDDPNVLWMAGRTRARVVTFGFGAGVDVRATDVRLDWPRGTQFSLHVNGSTHRVSTRLIGRAMVQAVVASAAAGWAIGRDLGPLLSRMGTVRPARGRMQPVSLANGATLLRDDYKSALETVDAALDVLAEVPASRRIVVLGDVAEPPGSQGDIHRAVGARVAEVADLAVFVGGGCSPYSSGARRAGMPRENVFKAGRNIHVAIDFLRGKLRSGDVVLIKGRNDQHLERVAVALAGRRVDCAIQSCAVRGYRCADCAKLETGRTRPARKLRL